MKSTGDALEGANIVDLSMEVTIEADAKTVWDALTANISDWWPGPFYCGGGTGKPSFAIEARPGGRMYEDWGNGEGLLWGTVVNLQIAKTLHVQGTTGPAWGGPNLWYAVFDLSEESGSTRLRFSESTFGRVAESTGTEKEKGWEFLLAALKANVEGGAAPEWQD